MYNYVKILILHGQQKTVKVGKRLFIRLVEKLLKKQFTEDAIKIPKLITSFNDFFSWIN